MIERALTRFLGAGTLAALVAIACGGTEFSAGPDTSGGAAGSAAMSGTGGSAASGGSSGTGGGGSEVCLDASDCDDAQPCTLDACEANGLCSHAPKCGGAEPRCCGGECGQCCGDADCDDGVACTVDDCFAGFCTNTPSACAGAGEYCDPVNGCMAAETCPNGSDAECDDGNACTTDVCRDRLCAHDACSEGTHCCPGRGCGTCCSDSQCADDDPCTNNVCESLSCVTRPLCEDGGAQCCPSVDGTSARCGVGCCTAADCPADNVACTVAVCRADGCHEEPRAERCEPGQTCDPELGCTGGGECDKPEDCPTAGACQVATCKSGSCEYEELDCADGKTCCSEGPNKGSCQTCCSNDDCSDNSGSGSETAAPLCCQADAACHECCSDLDCRVAFVGAAPPITTGMTIPCVLSTCDPQTRTCKQSMRTCPAGYSCCPDGSCSRACLATD